MRRQLAWLRKALGNFCKALGSFCKALGSLRKFDWSELQYASACGNWPVAVHVVICIGSVVLVLMIACLALLPGIHASWHAARDLSFALEAEHIALQEQFVIKLARHASITNRCPQCPMMQRYLRPSDAMPGVLDRLSQVAATHDIRVIALRPEKSWQHSAQRAFEIEVQLRADQHQLAAFLTGIGALPLAFAIKQADWALATPHLSLTLFLLVAENENSDDPSDFKFDKPDAAVAVDTNPAGDNQYELAEGRWQRVAFVRRGNRFLEVLRDGRGETRRRAGELTEVGQ